MLQIHHPKRKRSKEMVPFEVCHAWCKIALHNIRKYSAAASICQKGCKVRPITNHKSTPFFLKKIRFSPTPFWDIKWKKLNEKKGKRIDEKERLRFLKKKTQSALFKMIIYTGLPQSS